MSDPTPWISAEAGPEDKKHAPATLRNREAIATVLRGILPDDGKVLEIASGSGEHLVAFAKAFPALNWLPSDPDPECRRSIAAWASESGLENIAPPVSIDAMADPTDWPIARADAVLCINMVHISPWQATVGLMAGAGAMLSAGSPLYLYGPFKREGVLLADGNQVFDENLRSRNAEWGLRELADVEKVAKNNGFAPTDVIEMPANNVSVVFRKL